MHISWISENSLLAIWVFVDKLGEKPSEPSVIQRFDEKCAHPETGLVLRYEICTHRMNQTDTDTNTL